MKLSLVSSLTLVAALFVPAFAHADTFTVTSVPSGSAPNPFTLTFTLPHSPNSVTGFAAATYGFNVPVSVVRNGVTDSSDILTFYNTANGGGLADNDSTFFPFGPQLFTLVGTTYTFIDSTFNLSNESVGGATDYVITISGASTTPEPSSLALLGTGVLGLAGVARRRFTR